MTPTRGVTADGELDRLDFEFVGGGGPPILWLHGLEDPERDMPAIEGLADRYRVVVPTFPGFGDAPRPDHCDSVSDLVHMTLSLLERERLEDVAVVGCSFGGWVAAEMAVWRPARLGRLVLVDALGVRVGGRTDRDIADLFVVSAEDRRALLFHDPAKAGPLPADLDDDRLMRRLRSEEAAALYGWEPYMCNPKLLRRLMSVTLPTCVIWGAEDRLVGTDYGQALATAFPDGRFEVISAAGHSPHIEQTDAFLEVVGGFLERDFASSTPTPQEAP
jgi:pimeloyl-ACP methyl ester carboxylesterase